MLSHPHVLTNNGKSRLERHGKSFNPKAAITDLHDFTAEVIRQAFRCPLGDARIRSNLPLLCKDQRAIISVRPRRFPQYVLRARIGN
jgi:hypothetical protein